MSLPDSVGPGFLLVLPPAEVLHEMRLILWHFVWQPQEAVFVVAGHQQHREIVSVEEEGWCLDLASSCRWLQEWVVVNSLCSGNLGH